MRFDWFRRKKKKDDSVVLYTEFPEVSETGTKIPKDVLEREVNKYINDTNVI